MALQQVPAAVVEHTVYVFDGFQLDVTRRKLCSSGGVVQSLNSRAMEALLVLVSHAGQVVEKRRLMQAVWPAAIVEDNNLNQCVLSIRRALGETAGTNRFIMTVPGRGYCFVCPVRTLTSESAPDSTRASRGWRANAAWTGIGAMAGAASLLLWIGLQGAPAGHPAPAADPVRTRAAADPGTVLLRLRPLAASTTPGTARALPDCLMQRPDLRLQIEIRLIEPRSQTLVLAGHYWAEAKDIVPQQAPSAPRVGAAKC